MAISINHFETMEQSASCLRVKEEPLLYCKVGLEHSSNDLILNSTLIRSPENLEVSVVSPVGGPTGTSVSNFQRKPVVAQPVWCSILHTPSNDLDAVPFQKISSLVLVTE